MVDDLSGDGCSHLPAAIEGVSFGSIHPLIFRRMIKSLIHRRLRILSVYLYLRDQCLQLPVRLVPLSLGIALVLLNWGTLEHYVLPDLNVWLGLLILPWAMIPRHPGTYSGRYAWGAFACSGLYLAFDMNIFLFLAIGMALCLFVEWFWGKLSIYPLAIIGLISPVMKYLVQSFSFPLRLEMSQWIGAIMNQMGWEIAVEGNLFISEKGMFSVDPACMGLHAFATGMILTTLLLVFGEQMSHKKLSLGWIAALYMLTAGLVILTNGMRIAALILFQSLPETSSHELIGMFGVLGYVFIPMHFVIQWAYRKQAIGIKKGVPPRNFAVRRWIIPVWVGVGISVASVKGDQPLVHEPNAFENLNFPSMEKQILESGVGKFEHDSLLVYLKAPVPFWASDHGPTTCWQASGYEFQRIQETTIAGNAIYQAELALQGDTLHTAWWYESAKTRTNSQLEWRRMAAREDEAFFLVNLTSATAEQLKNELEKWMEQDYLKEQ